MDKEINVQREWFVRLLEVAKLAQDDPKNWLDYFFGYVDSAKLIIKINPAEKIEPPAITETEPGPEKTRTRKGGYTEEQEKVIIAMVANGIGATDIAKKLKKSVPAIYNKIKKMKEAGTIIDKPDPDEEEEDDGFREI
jgi:hypothetical protein